MAIYDRLEDASNLYFGPGSDTPVTCPTEYMAWQAELVMRRRLTRCCSLEDRVTAFVNHGRWLASCLRCGQGMFTHPEWRLACCAECGAIYRAVEFPTEIAEITRLLLERPDRTKQNWEPGESVRKLKLENFLHRLAA